VVDVKSAPLRPPKADAFRISRVADPRERIRDRRSDGA
jgi:hypothetical protein